MHIHAILCASKHHEDVLSHMVTSKQATIGERMQPNKQRGPQRLTSINPQRENKQEHGRDLDLSKQAWIQTQNAWKGANKAQKCKNELIQTLYYNLGVWM